MSRQLAEILFKDRIISQAQLADALAACKTGKSHIRHLIETRAVAETKLLAFLTQKFSLPSVNIAKFEISPDVLKLVPGDVAKKFQIIPVQANKGTIVVAICDPTAVASFEQVKFAIKSNVEAVLTLYSAFDAAMAKYYAGSASVSAAIEGFRKEHAQKEEVSSAGIELVQIHDIDTGASESDAPVITLCNGVLSECIRRSASDIHIEPYEKRLRVRLRVDGVLIEVAQIPAELKRPVTTRFKIMSRMDIAESRVPQDGRIKLKTAGKEVDFRVNSLPTMFGEKIVLRMLSQGNLQLDLTKLGFEVRQLEVFKKGIYMPQGMVLVTGPTGSGKTTTLYSALAELNKVSDNLATAEDPIEYNLDGINQTQVHKEIGLTFASVLRALLRQDPDTILVGEIRDYETAEVAVQAALTGHLVLSTLHTNDAPSTITRLMNMGLEPFLVVASLTTIVGQRLLRTICSKCKEVSAVPKEKLVQLGFTPDSAAQITCYKGKGCSLCAGTGYKGRVAIYEVLEFTPNLKDMVLRGENNLELKKQAVKEGMKSLRMSGLTKVAEGKTTLEEVLSLTTEN